MTGPDYTSILDKTDWRKTIHKALEDAVMSIGTEIEFFKNVEQAIQAMTAVYPNWDATTEINNKLKAIEEKHMKLADEYIASHKLEWCYPWNRVIKLIEWKQAMYMEILQMLKDVAGKHRMLLWGVKSVPEGQMGPDTDVAGNEGNYSPI